MNSYQTCWTIDTGSVHALSSSAFVMARTPKEAKIITEQALRNTYSDLESIQWHRTIARVPSTRFPGHYITATSNVEKERSL